MHAQAAQADVLWDAKAVGKFLGKHPNWVYLMARKGVLPSHSVGRHIRFDPAEIRAWFYASKPRGV